MESATEYAKFAERAVVEAFDADDVLATDEAKGYLALAQINATLAIAAAVAEIKR